MTALIEPGHPEWQTLITASKAAAILGVSPWESPRSMWHRLRGELPPEPDKAVFRRGHCLEDGILRWFYLDNPHLRDLGKTTVRHPAIPWAAGTPDSLAEDTETGEIVPVDAKTDGRGDGWGEPGTDQVPIPYAVQAMFVMHLGGWERFIFARLGPFLERDEFVVPYDAELAEDVFARCHTFYRSLSGDTPPDLDDTLATYDAVRAVAPIGEGDWQCPPELAHELCRSRADIEAAERRYTLARSRCIDAMGDAKRVVCGDQVLGQKQKTKSGAALYPPRKPVTVADLPPIDAAGPDRAPTEGEAA